MSFWKNKKVLVTGGAGFVGSYLVELLVDQKARVTVVDNLCRGSLDRLKDVKGRIDFIKKDLFELQNCVSACKNQDIVMNLAAKVTGIEYNRFNMADMFTTNMKLQMNMLEAAHKTGVKRFLQISTACVYPHDAKVPTPESEGQFCSPEPTNEGYGLAKWMGEKLSLYYVREKKMHVVIARPFNAYGPRDHYDEATSHVIPAIIKRVLDGDNPVAIWGSGNQSRAFVHAQDLARGMMLLIEKAKSGDIVNVGHDEQVSIKDLFYLICRVLNKKPKAFFDRSKPDGYKKRGADVRKLKAITGFVPQISLESGIREMVAELQDRGKKKQ